MQANEIQQDARLQEEYVYQKPDSLLEYGSVIAIGLVIALMVFREWRR